jgi:uncharacterized lipoprotein YddW (UPF0748 family)
VIFQVRPASDAFYASTIEPWSHWLTGQQGKSPANYYDPLEFFINEVHARSMEAHVWINPYRVSASTKQEFDKRHPFIQKRHLIKEYGNRYYFDPGYDETRAYLNAVVSDIVTRYDIDAVHFDDYFYPYKVPNADFPDDDSFRKESRGFTKKDDWRRNNVNLVIAELQRTIKSIKPWVEFGISPFGVWRNASADPRGSETYQCMNNYDDLYADILKWLDEGSIDYVTPQLYWETTKKNVAYKVLVDWWSKNANKSNLYIGLFASGLNTLKAPEWKDGNELARQLQINKDFPRQQGVFLYSARPLLKNPLGICDSLRNNFFKYPALVPTNKNIKGGVASSQPRGLYVTNGQTGVTLGWDKVQESIGKQVSYYVVYCFPGSSVGDLNNPQYIIGKTPESNLDISKYAQTLKGNYTFVVTSVNRYKYESAAIDYVVKRF